MRRLVLAAAAVIIAALLASAAIHAQQPNAAAAGLAAEAARLREAAGRAGPASPLLAEAASYLESASRVLEMQHLRLTTTTTTSPNQTKSAEHQEAHNACTAQINKLLGAINRTLNRLLSAYSYYAALEKKAEGLTMVAERLIANLQQQAGTSGSVVGPLGVDYAEMLGKAGEALHVASKIRLEESEAVLNYAQAILAMSKAVYGLAESCSPGT